MSRLHRRTGWRAATPAALPYAIAPCTAPHIKPLALALHSALLCMAFGIAAAPQHARAQASAPVTAGVHQFAIAAGPLDTALAQFARIAGINLTYEAVAVAGMITPGLHGAYGVDDGLQQLLRSSGSGLYIGKSTSGYTLVRQAQGTAESQVLPTVLVNGAPERSLPEAYAGGQVARGARLGILGNTDMMDTPFNVSSYTAKLIEDQQSATVAAVLQNDPSVRFTTSEGHLYENYSVRGFDINAEELAFNGMYGLSPYGHAPTEFIERVEVIKGPGALISGMSPQGAVGGIINLVPKRADDAPLTRVTAGYVSNSQTGLHVDFGRRFGDDNAFGIRVNTAYRDGGAGVDDQSKESMLGAVALDYRGSQLKLSLDAYSNREKIDNGSSWMASFTNGVVSPPKSGTNLLRGVYGELDNEAALLHGEYAFNNQLTAYAGVGALRYRYSGYVNGTRASVLNATGNYNGNTYNQRGGVDTVTSEAGLRAHFNTGPIAHQAVLGYTRLDYATYRATVNTSATFASNIYNPAIPRLAPDAGNAPKSGDTVLSGISLADTLSFIDDRILLTIGARNQNVRTRNYSATGLLTAAYDKTLTTPMGGLVVKPWAAPVSLYANYVEGLSQGDTVGDVTAANYGESFAPYQTKQMEAGVKWDQGSYTNTLSVFEIKRPGMTKNIATNRYEQNGEQRNRGVEWSLFGQILPQVRLLGGAAYTQAILTKAATAAYTGNTAFGVPKWKVNLGSEWDVPGSGGLTLTGRMVYTGPQFVNSSNTQRIPGWTRWDAGARYAVKAGGKDVTLRANVENLFDKSYWAGTFNDGYVTLSAQRTFAVSASIDF